MTADLIKLVSMCKAEVTVTFNSHRIYHQTVAEYLDDRELDPIGGRERYVEADSIVELQFYPRTPITSYVVVGATLDEVVAEGLKILEGDNE